MPESNEKAAKYSAALELARSMEARHRPAPKAVDSNTEVVVVEPSPSTQLPMWQDAVRGLPNALARGALFTAGKDEPRKYLKAAVIATLSNIKIVYQGQELRQDDSSVFMTVVHIARIQQLGEKVSFTAYRMLKELGWTNNDREYRHLQECFDRLSATSLKVQIDNGRAGYAGSLIRSFDWRDEHGKSLSRWCVLLEPKIVSLFGADAFTLIEWEERKQITHRAPLALWLHSFLCTHDEPLPMGVAKYKELCGSQEKSLYGFRIRLQNALGKLVRIGFLKSFDVSDAGLVRVKRAGSERLRGRSRGLLLTT